MAISSVLHFTHPHPLVMTYKYSYYTCDLCQVIGTGSRYCCSECDFYLHEHCTTYPASISTFLHPKHSISLVLDPTNNHLCDSCVKMAKGYIYRCCHCDFDLHPACSGLPHMNSQPSITDGIEQTLAGLKLGVGSGNTYPNAGSGPIVYSSLPIGTVYSAVSNISNYGQGYIGGSTSGYPLCSFVGAGSGNSGFVGIGGGGSETGLLGHLAKGAAQGIGKMIGGEAYDGLFSGDISFDF